MEEYSSWLWKKPGKHWEFFLLLYGHPVNKNVHIVPVVLCGTLFVNNDAMLCN